MELKEGFVGQQKVVGMKEEVDGRIEDMIGVNEVVGGKRGWVLVKKEYVVGAIEGVRGGEGGGGWEYRRGWVGVKRELF